MCFSYDYNLPQQPKEHYRKCPQQVCGWCYRLGRLINRLEDIQRDVGEPLKQADKNIMKLSKGKCENICIWDGITPCMQQYRLGSGLNRKQPKNHLKVQVDKSWPQVSSVTCSPRPHFTVLAKPQQVGELIIPFCSALWDYLCRTVFNLRLPSTRKALTYWTEQV